MMQVDGEPDLVHASVTSVLTTKVFELAKEVSRLITDQAAENVVSLMFDAKKRDAQILVGHEKREESICCCMQIWDEEILGLGFFLLNLSASSHLDRLESTWLLQSIPTKLLSISLTIPPTRSHPRSGRMTFSQLVIHG